MGSNAGLKAPDQLYNKVMLLGEAPGETEVKRGEPFVGKSGEELNRLLEIAGIKRDECVIANVFPARPPGNKLRQWCTTGKTASKDAKALYLETLPRLQLAYPEHAWPTTYNYKGLAPAQYLKPQYLSVIPRTKSLIEEWKPNLIIALGSTACWALFGEAGIASKRGVITHCSLVEDVKVLPVYHPAYILRMWSARTIAILDLQKAAREAAYPEIRRKERLILIPEAISELEYQVKLMLSEPGKMAYDIETERALQISCISFAKSSNRALVIPFIDPTQPDWNYWRTHQQEVRAWELTRELLSSGAVKITQNGIYDMQYLWKKAGTIVTNPNEDTMILHHALQPELKKDLGFLGSIYTDEGRWKQLRKSKTGEKKDA